MSLKLRKIAISTYNLIAPLISKTRVNRIPLGGKTLGSRVNPLLVKMLYCKLPEPTEISGMTIFHSPADGRESVGWGYAFDYEPKTRRIFEQIIKPSMTVVDVGANIGYYSLLAAKLVGNNGRVFAFEPDPAYYTLLKKNIEANGLCAIVESFRLAIGNTDNKAILFLGKCTSTSLFKVPDITIQTVVADVLTLDSFFAQRHWPPVDVIKIDVEGAEKMALEGMRALVKRNPKLKLIIELNSLFLEKAGASSQELLNVLAGLGFNQICVLRGEMGFYKIPEDIENLVSLGEKVSYLNLLCKKLQ